jgi:hypothetical protein
MVKINPYLNRILELEADVRYRVAALPGEDCYTYSPGTVPVLLSAPHGAAHLRNGRMKEEDEFTTGFARLVAEISGAHVLYTRRKLEDDPNYDREVPYKHHLKEIVQKSSIGIVMDIHGASGSHPFGLALGTMSGRSCPDHFTIILETLNRHGFSEHSLNPYKRLDIDKVFKGGGGERQETITRYCFEHLSTPAVQFELTPPLRSVPLYLNGTFDHLASDDNNMIVAAVDAFVDLVAALK